MRNLLPYLKKYRADCVLSPLFKLLEAIFDLLVPLVTAVLIDAGILAGNREVIWHQILLLILLALIGLAFSVTAQYFAARAASGFAASLRHELFAHVQGFTFSQNDQFGTETLITRLTSDVNQVQTGTNLALRLFLRSPFIVFGAMIMAFTVDVQGALVFVVLIPLLFGVVFGILFKSMPLYRKVQQRLDLITGATRENLTGVRVIRAFNQEEKEIRAYGDNHNALTDLQKTVGRLSALTNPVTFILLNTGLIILLYTGALRIDAGGMTSGEVVALTNYMGQILTELIKLSNLMIQVSRSLACANRISEVLDSESGIREGTEKLHLDHEIAVEFQHADLRYHEGGELALEDITFQVKRGETVGIIGGTGSGKTSLVHLIPRYYDATKGRVLVFGQDVKAYPSGELRDRIGMVFQKAELFQGTIRENLLWGKEDATDEEVNEALAVSQAAEFVFRTPKGLDHQLEQNARNLSGGQKQRLNIARAIVKQPEILILDDSASALDFATDAKLRMAIRKLSGKMTTFIVSQRAASVMACDRIIVMDDGKIDGTGSHEELLRSNKIYREIYESQFAEGGENETE